MKWENVYRCKVCGRIYVYGKVPIRCKKCGWQLLMYGGYFGIDEENCEEVVARRSLFGWIFKNKLEKIKQEIK